MSPLLVVIVTFGLIFVVPASLGQCFAIAPESLKTALAAHSQLDVMLLISNFIVLPALMIGLASLIDFNPEVKVAIVVVLVFMLELGLRLARKSASAVLASSTAPAVAAASQAGAQ